MATLCKGCEEERPLIKAHVIPRSFFLDLKGDSPFLHSLGFSDGAAFDKKSPAGEYDQGILCKECDGHIGKLDQYGKEFFIEQSYESKPVYHGLEEVGLEVTGIDGARLSKFILSIIWRASISERDFSKNVRLGPHSPTLKEFVFNDVVTPKSFGCFLYKFSKSRSVQQAEKIITSPVRDRLGCTNYYKFCLAGYSIWVRVDQSKPRSLHSQFEMGSGQKIMIPMIDYDKSSEYKNLKAVFATCRLGH